MGKLESAILLLCDQMRRDLIGRFPQYANTLKDISFKVNKRMRTTAGRADYVDKQVEIALQVFSDPNNIEQLKETILHEIAHILAPFQGHNVRWKRIATQIGCSAMRCHSMDVQRNKRKDRICVPCPNCGTQVQFGPTQYRRAQNGVKYRHKQCGAAISLAKGNV